MLDVVELQIEFNDGRTGGMGSCLSFNPQRHGLGEDDGMRLALLSMSVVP
jgi:hypothetical protein